MELTEQQASILLARRDEIDAILALLKPVDQRQFLGIDKLAVRLRAERKHLESVIVGKKKMHETFILSNNIPVFAAMARLFFSEREHVGVMVVKKSADGLETSEVDVLCHEGRLWILVTARDKFAVEKLCDGEGEFGHKDIIGKAEMMLRIAQDNKCGHIAPQLAIVAVQGFTESVAERLRELGVLVGSLEGRPAHEPLFDDVVDPTVESPLGKAVNLDITALIVVVSEVIHTDLDSVVITGEVYQNQGKSEQSKPTLPLLEDIFARFDRLVCTKFAWQEFSKILEYIGGPNEKQRAAKFRSRIELIENEPSERVLALPETNNMKLRHRMVFGTGDRWKIPTLTSNFGFLRAASEANCDLDAILHPARALCEKRMSKKFPFGPEE